MGNIIPLKTDVTVDDMDQVESDLETNELLGINKELEYKEATIWVDADDICNIIGSKDDKDCSVLLQYNTVPIRVYANPEDMVNIWKANRTQDEV